MKGRKQSTWRRTALVLIVLLPVLLGGCLEDADKKSYDYNNALDPGKTSATSGSVEIAAVIASDMVLLVNMSGVAQDLTGWSLSSEASGSTPYTFGAITLPNPGYIRIWSSSGTDGFPDYYGSTLTWSSSAVKATLKDQLGNTVDECFYSSITTTCWNP